ncbi:hypothetical protein Ahy_B07g087056 [Arachis hypogaea]|uniref:Protein FAR1-RELATED SEQUENCE n=1 Tax=Arachis hypogaea TaxID=3818 RepID=A0A444YBH3_ARAHY|nr:hypothetical protein Ahy_B07g087056 [Arachis hypogaea]
MDSSLSGLPLLGRDEKHTKVREHAYFFNKFITRNSSLIQFVKQYDNCLGSREQREREFDAVNFYTVIPCATKITNRGSISARVYSRKVQAKLRDKVNCITRSTNFTIGFTSYEVVEQVSNSVFNKFVVTYDALSREIKCQCLLFESRSILCRHSLSALSFERVDKVEPKYILKCWSKNVKRRHTHIKSSLYELLLETRSKRFDDLKLTGNLHQTFDNVMAEMQEYQAKNKGKCSLSHEDATLSDVNDLQSPPRIRTRGRSKNRLGSNMKKKIANATKKKKKPALSELNLLDGGLMI